MERRLREEEKATWRSKLKPNISCIDLIVKYLSRIRYVLFLHSWASTNITYFNKINIVALNKYIDRSRRMFFTSSVITYIYFIFHFFVELRNFVDEKYTITQVFQKDLETTNMTMPTAQYPNNISEREDRQFHTSKPCRISRTRGCYWPLLTVYLMTCLPPI